MSGHNDAEEMHEIIPPSRNLLDHYATELACPHTDDARKIKLIYWLGVNAGSFKARLALATVAEIPRVVSFYVGAVDQPCTEDPILINTLLNFAERSDVVRGYAAVALTGYGFGEYVTGSTVVPAVMLLPHRSNISLMPVPVPQSTPTSVLV